MSHHVLARDVTLDCLNLFEDFVLVFGIVAVELIVVGFYSPLQHLQYLLAHPVSYFSSLRFALDSDSFFFDLLQFMDNLVQFVDFFS